MSWKIVEKYRSLLAAETGDVATHRGGTLAVCLVYPNRYRIAMSNLGFQTVYAQFNAIPGVQCERAFLPDPEDLREYEKTGSRLMSLESQRPLCDFDVIAFSVSFESDYLHIPLIFRLSGILPCAADRGDASPLVLAGGAALFLNPEPVADFMDIVCLGESEAMLPALADLLMEDEERDRHGLLVRAAALPGIYVPAFYEVGYDGPSVVSRRALHGAPEVVERQVAKDLDRHPTSSVILTPGTEFSDLYLVELSRGCPRGCRFCAAGFIYEPYRQRTLQAVREQVAEGLGHRAKLGLVGAAVSDYSDIGALCRHIRESGGTISVSSLRIDGLDDEMIRVLKESGHKTVALAPEGGSQRMRDLIRKNITEEQILSACDRLIGHDILNLKLYFIIGLPTETEADLEEMVGLVSRIRERVVEAARKNKRLGEVALSVNPFVPKPFTPFQWCGMEGLKSLEKKLGYLQQAVRRMANVRLQAEAPREAWLQALLSRGDRRLSIFLVRAEEAGSWKRALRETVPDADLLVSRTIPLGELLPWDFIGGGSRERLVAEYRKSVGR
jgi:radical SAM superfamily enzyme YgiQ (UPF0313 family)